MHDAHVFDCDGVLLDTVEAKANAFYTVALPYGRSAAEQLVAYHKTAGAIGRRARWVYFFEHILNTTVDEQELEYVVQQCSDLVRIASRTARLVPGVIQFILTRPPGHRAVISGIEQDELKDLLEIRSLDMYFESIHGGAKGDLLIQYRQTHNLQNPIYYGDEDIDGLYAAEAGYVFQQVDPAVGFVRQRTL